MKKTGFIFNKTGCISVMCGLLSVLCVIGPAQAAEFDTEDPLYFEQARDLTLRSNMFYGGELVGAGFRGSYGINDLFVLGMSAAYQQDFDSERDHSGFTGMSLDAMYRLSSDLVLSDIFGGIKFAGGADPALDKTIFSGGVRLGRQWDKSTLSVALKTSWIFDELGGMAWIDLMPDAYFRINENWRFGLGLDLRKATNPEFDATIAGLKLARQYGRTQYVATSDYDFKQSDFILGAHINIAF